MELHMYVRRVTTEHDDSQKFPQRCLWNGCNVRLIGDGPLSSFRGRSSSASSLHASLLRAISGVMSLALCLQVVSQDPQHFRSSEKQATCEGSLLASLSARSFPFTPAYPGQYTHRRFRRLMSTIDTVQSAWHLRDIRVFELGETQKTLHPFWNTPVYQKGCTAFCVSPTARNAALASFIDSPRHSAAFWLQ